MPGQAHWRGEYDTFKPTFQGPRADQSMALDHASNDMSPYVRWHDPLHLLRSMAVEAKTAFTPITRPGKP